MFRLIKLLISSCAILLLAISLISCGGSGSPAATGTLSIGLTDAPGDYLNVFVTIAEVHVHHETQGWETLTSPELKLPQTVDLLDLVNGVTADLGIAELAAGHYNQMRLILGTQPENPGIHHFANYLVIEGEEGADPVVTELKVPSGFQTGIKIVNGFDIVASGATELVLDFDSHRSIVQKGNGNFSLKPTIKVLETLDNSVNGTVQDGVGSAVEGALVSAQVYTPPSEPPAAGWDPADEVAIEGGTSSDADGNFLLYLPPDIYNIVVTMNGYLPLCQEVEAQFFEAYSAAEVFVLQPVGESGTLSGLVSGLAEAASALISIRQSTVCGTEDVMIEVASLHIANDTAYNITLPVGSYQIVASAEGEETLTFDVIVADTPETVQAIDFTPVP
jgi:hypothetical protein